MKPGSTGKAQGEKYTRMERIIPRTNTATNDVDGSSHAIRSSMVSVTFPVRAFSTEASNSPQPPIGVPVACRSTM